MERFPEALGAIPDAVVIVDAEGVVRAGNASAESVFGYPPEELTGIDIDSLLTGPLRSDGEAFRRYLLDSEPRSVAAGIDLTAHHEDGRELPVTVSLGSFERDGETHLVLTVVDVSAERAETAALQRRTERLEALHEATQDLLKTTDKAVAAEAAVEYIEEVLGHPLAAIWLHDEARELLEPAAWTAAAADLIGQHPTFHADEPSISWQVFESGKPEYVPDTHADPDQYNRDSSIRSELVLPLGRYGVINVGATEADAFDGADLAVARLWAATVTMVFVRIERERQLRARESEIVRERDRLAEFASLVSHDLRNPLNVATGNLDLVRERLAEERMELSEVDTVIRSLDRMEALVEDMLTLAKQGSAIDETEPVSLAAMIEECWTGVDTEDAELVVAGDCRFQADRSRLRQALENLLANAVTHGGPSVRVEVGPLDDGTGFYVADDGPGIPADIRATVFDAGVTTDRDGTGFGLKIVSEVADAHGWSVSVAGGDGGAHFEFRGVEAGETDT